MRINSRLEQNRNQQSAKKKNNKKDRHHKKYKQMQTRRRRNPRRRKQKQKAQDTKLDEKRLETSAVSPPLGLKKEDSSKNDDSYALFVHKPNFAESIAERCLREHEAMPWNTPSTVWTPPDRSHTPTSEPPPGFIFSDDLCEIVPSTEAFCNDTHLKKFLSSLKLDECRYVTPTPVPGSRPLNCAENVAEYFASLPTERRVHHTVVFGFLVFYDPVLHFHRANGHIWLHDKENNRWVDPTPLIDEVDKHNLLCSSSDYLNGQERALILSSPRSYCLGAIISHRLIPRKYATVSHVLVGVMHHHVGIKAKDLRLSNLATPAEGVMIDSQGHYLIPSTAKHGENAQALSTVRSTLEDMTDREFLFSIDEMNKSFEKEAAQAQEISEWGGAGPHAFLGSDASIWSPSN